MIDYEDDILTMQSIATRLGFAVSNNRLRELWEEYSDAAGAEWLTFNPEEDEAVLSWLIRQREILPLEGEL